MNTPKPASSNNSNTYFLVAFGLINILAFTLLLCAVSLLAGSVIGKWQFPVACVLALVVNCFTARSFAGAKARRLFVRSGCAVLILLIGSVLVAGYFYDFSFDGQWYHQEAVSRLKQGYNPAYHQLSIPADELSVNNSNDWCLDAGQHPFNYTPLNSPPINLKFLAINYFSKGTEIINTAIYQVTNRIETGKAVNMIILIASFFLCLSLLYKIDRIGTGSKWLLAFILAFNPVAINELPSFCVDGFAACLLLCLLVTFCLLWLQQSRYYLLLLGCLIIITVNVKFTTLVYAAMFCLGFLIVLFIYKKMAVVKQVLTTGIIAAVIGIFCCGFNPYVTNMVKEHNIFYGLKETNDEIIRLTPKPLLNLNRFEQLFLSLSAHQGWALANGHTASEVPKVPFAITKSDLYEGIDTEPPLSGFGPFFSGALLIAIAVFVVALIYFRKTQAFKLAGTVLLIIIATVVVIPVSWWARFVPQLWLLPVVILLMAEFISFRGERILKTVLYLSMVLNIAWSSLIIVSALTNTARINYQLQQLKAINEPVHLIYCNYRNFKSNRIRFDEAGIPVTDKSIGGHYVYDLTSSTTKVETPVPLPDLPKPFLLKFSEKLK